MTRPATPSRRAAEDIAERVAKVQRDGYASSAGMLHRNFAAIAAPILDYSNRIAATVTLLGPTDYVDQGPAKGVLQAGLLGDPVGVCSGWVRWLRPRRSN
jgi:DNA-binding IclR family transcriptional regulator